MRIDHQANAFTGDDVHLLRHFLAAIAYRTQKAVRGAGHRE